jgi:hypothetical protein
MTSLSAAPLFLHIGQGKAGSSTIQSLAADHREFMETAGISCPLTLDGHPNHMRLASALSDPESDRPTVKRFTKDLARAQGRKVFVSSEGLGSINVKAIRRLKRIVRDREVRILFYLRDYPGRLPSMYAQANKRALNTRNFDAYFGRLTYETVSVLPRLDRWAGEFGWPAIRVRTLHPDVLVGGDLVRDVLHVLGVEAPRPVVVRKNESPHWIVVECQRALAAMAVAAGTGELDSKSRRLSRQLFEMCAADSHPNRAQYVTRAQWHALAEWYRRDLVVLGERMGMSFPTVLEEPAERQFLPCFAAVPDAVKAGIRTHLRKPGPGARLSRQVAALIDRLLEEGEPALDAAGVPAAAAPPQRVESARLPAEAR